MSKANRQGRGVQISTTPGRADRHGAHSEIFSLDRDFLANTTAKTVLNTDYREGVGENSIKSYSYEIHLYPEAPDALCSPISFHLPETTPMIQLELGLPSVTRGTAECRHCGRSFSMAAGSPGRPTAFCGDPCRREHKLQQMRAWRRRNAGGERVQSVTCLHCGAALEPEARCAGRVRRLCSDECRRARRSTQRASRQAERVTQSGETDK